MQNKGAIRFFAIAFALVCVFQLSYTYFAKSVEKDAYEYANSAKIKGLSNAIANGNNLKEGYIYDSISKSTEKVYLDSIQNEVVYNIGIRKYTFKEVKEREINLGLDLKGGMNVTLEISVPDIVKALSGNSKNPVFNQALKNAIQKQKSTDVSFIDLFDQAIKEIDPNFSLATVFSTIELKDKVSYNSSNADILKVLNDEVDGAINRTFNILNTRINRFGVAQPNIQQLQTKGRILVELPGIKDPDRVRKLLQGTAQLEFWETFDFPELIGYFSEANAKLAEINELKKIQTVAPETALVSTQTTETAVAQKVESSLIEQVQKDTTANQNAAYDKYLESNPLWAVLQPSLVQDASGQSYPAKGARVGFAAVKDTARVNALIKQVRTIFPSNLKLFWAINPVEKGSDVHELVAIKVSSRDGLPALGGDVIVDASQDYSPTGQVEVSMSMNSEGAQAWKRLTGENIGKQIAIVLDNYVYSFPVVNAEISGGRSSISGGGMT
ncbi:MAG TPA: protein translocase subunit SecDF, partial [Bacteroidales bacterium]|nr:protein translocase subunit SecDF [Bacteroidales bacterium]